MILLLYYCTIILLRADVVLCPDNTCINVKEKLQHRSKTNPRLLKVRQERASANRAFKQKHGLSYAGAVKRPAAATDEEGGNIMLRRFEQESFD